MAIVTVVKSLPSEPTKQLAKQVVRQHLPELMTFWSDTYGSFLAGKRFVLLAFPPGDYAPAKSGPIRDARAFQLGGGGTFSMAFSVTDDARAEKSPHSLWILNPDPEFFPDGA